MATSSEDDAFLRDGAKLLLNISETSLPDGRRSVVREALDPATGRVARRETEEFTPSPHAHAPAGGGGQQQRAPPRLVREESVVTELPDGTATTSTKRYYADGASSVVTTETFPLASASAPASAPRSECAVAGGFGPSGGARGRSIAGNVTGAHGSSGHGGHRLAVSPNEGTFVEEEVSALTGYTNERPSVLVDERSRIASYREGALMNVQDSDEEKHDDDDWSTEPQSTMDEAASGAAGEGRWRSKMSVLASRSGEDGRDEGLDSKNRAVVETERGPRPEPGARYEVPEDAKPAKAAAPGAAESAAAPPGASDSGPEMGLAAPDRPPADGPRSPSGDDPALAKKLSAYARATGSFAASDPSAAPSSAGTDLSVAAASRDDDNGPSSAETYVAAEIGERAGPPPPVAAAAASAASSAVGQSLRLPVYRSVGAPAPGPGGGDPSVAGAIPVFAAPPASAAPRHDAEEASSKAPEGGGDEYGSAGVFDDVAVATAVHKDDFKTHLRTHRKTQIGCAVLALAIVGLAVGLGVALGVKPNNGGSTEAEEDSDLNFWEMSFPNIDGEHKEGDFGASVSMNQDGTRVAIGSPGVWDDDGEEFLRRGVVEVRELQDGHWVRLGQEIKLSARDSRDHILIPSADVRNLIQVVLSGDGDTVAVGTSFHDDSNKTNVGQVEVFQLKSGDWVRVGDPIVGSKSSDFAGASVSLSDDGGFVAVGAPGNDDNGEDTGCVSVFFNNRDAWNRLGRDSGTCDMSGAAPGERFGGSVSLSADGKSFAVGLSATRGSGSTTVAKVFKFVGGDWRERGTGIKHGQRIYDTAYSAVMSSDGSRVVVSNHYIGENGPEIQSDEKNVDLFVGAFHFRDDLDDWAPMGVNLHLNSEGDKSGYFISLSDDGSMIGMGDPGRSVNGGKVAGHAHIYVYDEESGDYIQEGPNIEGEAAGDRFGYEVALSGNGRSYAIGAPSSRGNGFEHGRVQVYEVPVA